MYRAYWKNPKTALYYTKVLEVMCPRGFTWEQMGVKTTTSWMQCRYCFKKTSEKRSKLSSPQNYQGAFLNDIVLMDSKNGLSMNFLYGSIGEHRAKDKGKAADSSGVPS